MHIVSLLTIEYCELIDYLTKNELNHLFCPYDTRQELKIIFTRGLARVIFIIEVIIQLTAV